MMAVIAKCAAILTLTLVMLSGASGEGSRLQPGLLSRTSDPAPPKWAEQYEVEFTFEIPYIKRYQPEGLTYYYKIWQDRVHRRQRMERGTVGTHALETVIEILDENVGYTLHPHKDRMECSTAALDEGGGPTRQGDAAPAAPVADGAAGGQSADPAAKMAQSRRSLQSSAVNGAELTFVLPDVTADRWEYVGTEKRANQKARVWRLISEPSEGYGSYQSNYTFYVTKDDVPLELNMWGINLYTGGHFDNYVVHYTGYKAGNAANAVFEKPSICDNKPLQVAPAASWRHDLHAQVLSLLPNPFYGDEEYDKHVHTHGRRHKSAAEYDQRRLHYQANKRYIEEWNAAPGGSYQLAMNHLGDISAEEHRAGLAGNRAARAAWAASPAMATADHVATVPLHLLPTTVDWRGSPADSPVKNQGGCGSCWAFGAVGALESAYYRATGEQKLFSEQQLVDCSWDVPEGPLTNRGCYDGYQQLALKWVFDINGGLASEADYPYIGVTNYCNTTKPVVKFKKGIVTRVKGFELGLKEALLTKGPMTVSVDAGHEDFRFYKSGIYNNTACQTVPVTELDHAVIVSGYGSLDGQDFWIVKNTWSSYWGEDGYIRIARQPADCGIATDPIYIDLEL